MRPSTAVEQDHATSPTRHARAHAARRRRARHRTGAVLAVVVATVATALPAAATGLGATTGSGTEPAVGAGASLEPGASGTGALPAPGNGTVRPQDTIEDEEAWCGYLSSYYLSFPSPWSARVINCRHSGLFVAPVYSDGSLGMCVLVPARHSRHLGGNIARWVTDIRLC